MFQPVYFRLLQQHLPTHYSSQLSAAFGYPFAIANVPPLFSSNCHSQTAVLACLHR